MNGRGVIGSVVALATSAYAATALAQIAPKVCVAVVGDADPAVRTAARDVGDALGAAGDLRVVADEHARGALRGEDAVDPALGDVVGLRRRLTGAGTDGSVLDGLGDRLGCRVTLTLAATATGYRLRAYDTAMHVFGATGDTDHVDAPLAERLVRAVLVPAPPGAIAGASPIVASPTSTPSVPLPVASAGSPVPPPVTSTSPDPRVTATPAPVAVARPAPVWPWIIAGVAAAGFITAFIVLETAAAPQPVLHVYRGAGDASP